MIVPTPNQRDVDNDGIGDICDGDFDQTCMVNAGDPARLEQVFLHPSGPAALPKLCP